MQGARPKAEPFIMVKPDGARYLLELEQVLLEHKISIRCVYYVSDWERAARSLYEPELQSCGREFCASFESHVWLTRYLFGNQSLVLTLDIRNDNQDIRELARIVHEIKDYFRSRVPESRDGTFLIALNLDRLSGDFYQGIGTKGVLGILSSEGFFTPLSEDGSIGSWEYHYFKYIHAPDGAEELMRQWRVLVQLGIVFDENRISKQEWELLKTLRCLVPPNRHTSSEP